MEESSIVTTGATSSVHSRRSGVRSVVADPHMVDGGKEKKKSLTVSTQHIVRIVTGDGDEGTFTEVTQEQIDRVRIMHDRMSEGASFSFNYNTLLVVASILAGFGLVSNSATTVIASMLVSPIMGPVIGLAYGSTIRDWDLVYKSFKTESISILVCIAVGVIIAAISGPTALSEEWPTDEMESRTTMKNFYVALPIAFFSGLGVAVSLLDDQTSSLVGVAISASLLPPAVNSGLMWIAYLFSEQGVLQTQPVADLSGPEAESITWEDVLYALREVSAEDLDRADYRSKGIISLGLTLANVALIWISSMLMFRLKEVLPVQKKIFWEDLTVARKIYQRRAVLQQPDIMAEETMEEGLMEAPSTMED